MSRLTDLISQVKARDAELGRELEREFKALSSRLPFGLNFERHSPESVELPGRPVRKGDKVRVLPLRGSTSKGDRRVWRVIRTEPVNAVRVAHIEIANGAEHETREVPCDDLIVAAEFRDYIYPGLVSSGKVERGGNKPFHTVINAENYHALEALTFTHRGKIDAIYIDPPYNTGAKDWKYNNDYVEGEDIYRHSKWLAMMERRLMVARELLNPADSVLIVTIDEKEYLRLGLLLEQVFPDGEQQMVSIVTSALGSARDQALDRVHEYAFFVYLGAAGPAKTFDPLLGEVPAGTSGVRWGNLLRSGSGYRRSARPNLFYPIFVDNETGRFAGAGESKPLSAGREEWEIPEGCFAFWPQKSNGEEARWQISQATLVELFRGGYARLGVVNAERGTGSVAYLMAGQLEDLRTGRLVADGFAEDGSLSISHLGGRQMTTGKSIWFRPQHAANLYGTQLVKAFLGGRAFPYPKSLYAVEDSLRFAVANKPTAIILDFFSGSCTTAHAVMRLNKQDGGQRQCISVTNNEVAADEQKRLREQGLRPGDAEWEKWGICDYITKPRVRAAITGKTPQGEPIEGDYKFIDEFPMADGFAENAEFFTLTYETPVAVGHNYSFARIAPLLWMRAGSEGRRIDELPEKGWDVTDVYGLLTDLDRATAFTEAVDTRSTVHIAYIVSDDERRFQSIAQRLPHTVEPVRLYEAYLTNFRFSVGR